MSVRVPLPGHGARRLVAGILLLAVLAAPSAAVTLTERSDAVLSAATALRAAELMGPELAQAVGRVVEAYRARNAHALGAALDQAERLLEPAAASWDPARIDLRAWEIAEGDTILIAVWRRDRELLALESRGFDERSLYFRLKGDTRVRAVALAPPEPGGAGTPGFIPPDGYGAWKFARERIERIAAHAARPLVVLADLDPGRPDAVAWDRSLRRDGITRIGDPGDAPGSGMRVTLAPDSWTATDLFVSAARSGGARHALVPGRGGSEGPAWALLEEAVALAGDTPRILAWRQGTAAALYAPGIVLVGNASALPLQVDLFTGYPEAAASVTAAGATFSRPSTRRYGRLRVIDAAGRVEQDARIPLGARLRPRIPAGGLWSLVEDEAGARLAGSVAAGVNP